MKKMKRIMIIGGSGAGKSTLAREIHQKTGLKLIHLDQYHWKPNWTEPSKADWEAEVAKLSAGEEWIMDGNFGSSMDIRIERADTIIFMHYPTTTCLYRVIKRTLKYWGKVRPDMTDGCTERFDLDFLHYVATFNLTRAAKLQSKLDKLQDIKQVLILKNDADTTQLLAQLTNKSD